jgi:tRNA(adenine34) deaminase
MQDHTTWMQLALREAQKAFEKGEAPIGAVIIHEGRIIGRGHNLMETLQDPTAHAEMLAITSAANTLAAWRLNDCILYVTLEPCIMCTGAILLSRIPTIVYGAKDPRYGACGSAVQLAQNDRIDVQAEIIGGVLEADCSELIRLFFRKIRLEKSSGNKEGPGRK